MSGDPTCHVCGEAVDEDEERHVRASEYEPRDVGFLTDLGSERVLHEDCFEEVGV